MSALSGTSLTVTTLTTAGLLSNNTSGQVSSVTGSTLSALLGGAPTFTGLTLSGLSSGLLKVTNGLVSVASTSDYLMTAGANIIVTGLSVAVSATPSFTGLTLSGLASGMLKVTAGVVSVATAGTDYQTALTPGTNITITSGTIATSATPSFTSLTISGLASGLLKVTSGVVSVATAGTDYQTALTAGTNITITNGTIDTTTLPTFAGINCVSIGNQNTLCGTSAGLNLLANGSGGNTFIGYQSGMACTSGGLNLAFGNNALSGSTSLTGQGYNLATGISALRNLGGTSQYNIGIGYLTGFNLITGSNNLYIGSMANSSSGTVSNEGVINLTGTSTAGRGTNTMLINATAGLFSYSPAYCMLVSTNFNNGIVTWSFWNDGATTYNNGFTLYNTNTLVVQPFAGLYEINFSGTAVSSYNLAVVKLNVNNIKMYDVSHNSSGAINGYAIAINGSTLSRPYVSTNPLLTGWSVNMQACYYWQSANPLFMMIKFISL